MRTLVLLVVAALLEVGGDALVRAGLERRAVAPMLAGGAVLVAYGFMVNLTKLDFSRLMGVYIVIFFLVAQGVAVLVFKERLALPVLVGGLLVVSGGLTMTLWRQQ
jgi:small multidrug resistance family-3 protein